MNREIKFRAWDKSINHMSDVGEIHYCQGGIKVFGAGFYLGNGWATEANGHKHDCDVDLMQFTGLLDSNGKEIYDGDIVKVFDECFPEEFSIGKVEWGGADYPAYDIYVPSTKQNMELENFCEDYNSLAGDIFCIEVIGNIYENPELLETKK